MTDERDAGSEPLTLDVREDLRQGKEPFQRIMSAVDRLRPGQALRLLATFEPVPLFQVMKGKGFLHEAKPIGGGDWEVLFTPRDRVLDLRELPPAERHPLIWEEWERTRVGQQLILINDHDPKPLYYQFEAEQPDRFRWSYLEEGPLDWRVAIERVR